jgi:hypothetical protein
MFATIAVVLIVLWVLGHLVFKITKGVIHILLVIGAVLLVLHFLRA